MLRFNNFGSLYVIQGVPNFNHIVLTKINADLLYAQVGTSLLIFLEKRSDIVIFIIGYGFPDENIQGAHILEGVCYTS